MRLPIPDPDGTYDTMTVEVEEALVGRWDAAVSASMTAVELVQVTLDTMGADYDSLDREALFSRACLRFGRDYEDLYQAWLTGAAERRRRR